MIEQNQAGIVSQLPGDETLPSGTGRTFTTSDGVEHYARRWQCDAAVTEKAILVYIHGIEGHSLWFDRTAQALLPQGISSYALDRRGAGLSREARGHVSDHRRLTADIEEILLSISAAEGGQPLFLMANCWGAKPAIVASALRNSPMTGRIAGLILTSPAITVKVDVDFLTKVKIGLSYLLRDEKRFAIPLTPEHFTDNPEYLQFIRDDSLRLKEATASFFLQSLILTNRAIKASADLTLPVLVLQSGRDGIVVVEQIEKWFDKVASKDKTFEMFPEATHSLDFETDPQCYLQILAGWVLERAK